jgi:hypothetical protein
MNPLRRTLLEIAQHHVAEGEARVAYQTALVAELVRDGRNTARAQAYLATLNDTLVLMHGVLAREQERTAKARHRH